MKIRLDGYPLYAFVPEWMVVVYTICCWLMWINMQAKYDALGEI